MGCIDSGNTDVTLETAALRLCVDCGVGGVTEIVNKVTGETFSVSGDAVSVEASGCRQNQAELAQTAWTVSSEELRTRYESDDLTVEVIYRLVPESHFFEKRLSLRFASAVDLTRVVLSRPRLTGPEVDLVCYRYPDFNWVSEYVEAKHGFGLSRSSGSEPTRTFFGRTAAGGFFAGVEMPFDDSSFREDEITLAYSPNLVLEPGERIECEPMYFGVYRRNEQDRFAGSWGPISAREVVGADADSGFNGAAAAGLNVGAHTSAETDEDDAGKVRPLPSESRAMGAFASAVLGPPRHGLTAIANGWHSQMAHEAYESTDELEGDLQSLQFLSECGIDGLTESAPWAGETEVVARLREGERYEPNDRVRRFLRRAGELGLSVIQWPTINNTHPWKTYGGPFRMDRPEWLRGVKGEALGGANADNFRRRLANCMACEPFYDWLRDRILDDALGTGLYGGYGVDGDFWGTGAFFHTTVPVTCLAEGHDHLPGDANYACQRRLDQLNAEVRRRYPSMFIAAFRPAMDLGVWSLRNVDACFTLIESGTGGSNIAAGNEVRTASRIRVHHHFYPHWLDWPLLFPSCSGPDTAPNWPSEKIDYLMLSALSCSPNLLLYFPTKSGIPDEDKVEISRWLNWGRRNVDYLMVRHDLAEWPCKGSVDGSAHLLGSHGLVFLFNPEPSELVAELHLSRESVGFVGREQVCILQEYPASAPGEKAHSKYRPGATVRWPVPAESVVVLRVEPETEAAV